MKTILGLLEKHAPLKRRLVKGKNAPWFTAEVYEMCKSRDKSKLKAQADKEALKLYKQAKCAVSNKIRQNKKDFLEKKFDSAKTSEDAWDSIDKLISFRHKNTAKICKLVTNEGIVLEDDASICKQFATKFTVKGAVSSTKHCNDNLAEYVTAFMLENPDYSEVEDSNITATEVEMAIKYVKKKV